MNLETLLITLLMTLGAISLAIVWSLLSDQRHPYDDKQAIYKRMLEQGDKQ